MPQIDYCLDLYNHYLSKESYYKRIYETLCSKKALATKDLELITSVLDNYLKNHDCHEIGKHYYDILYDKGSICLKELLLNDAINIFIFLSKSYKGRYDIGASLQSLALCYMAQYKDRPSLIKAEETYRKALDLFISINDKNMCGNVWDGLSYCLILQQKYQEAEKASLHSLEISEYNTPNKYANYISSLLCQNREYEAVSFFSSLPCKEFVKQQLINDWKTEMRDVGIDTNVFNLLFHKSKL
jgi:tetratricopeptide (TPR) repeat protein